MKPTIEELEKKWVGKRVAVYGPSQTGEIQPPSNGKLTGVVKHICIAPEWLNICVDGYEQNVHNTFHIKQCRLLKPRKKQSVEGYVSEGFFNLPDAYASWSLSTHKVGLGNPVRVRVTRIKDEVKS